MHYPGAADFSDHSPCGFAREAYTKLTSGTPPSEARGNGFATADFGGNGASTNTLRDAVNGRSPEAEKDLCPKSDGIIPETALDRACAEIFARWARFVPENEAREQAEAFRARCETLATAGHLTEPELDATLELVADAMAAA
jgi:hypothetical protein